MTSGASERIGRVSRQEDLRGNLLALAEVSTNLAGALEAIHYQDNSAPVPGQSGRPPMPMHVTPGMLGMPTMPMPMPHFGTNAQGGPGSGDRPPSNKRRRRHSKCNDRCRCWWSYIPIS